MKGPRAVTLRQLLGGRRAVGSLARRAQSRASSALGRTARRASLGLGLPPPTTPRVSNRAPAGRLGHRALPPPFPLACTKPQMLIKGSALVPLDLAVTFQAGTFQYSAGI